MQDRSMLLVRGAKFFDALVCRAQIAATEVSLGCVGYTVEPGCPVLSDIPLADLLEGFVAGCVSVQSCLSTFFHDVQCVRGYPFLLLFASLSQDSVGCGD